MAFNLICIGVLLQHSKQRRLIIQNVMNVSDNLDQRILHFNKTKVYKRQRPNKQVCTFLFRRKDFAAGPMESSSFWLKEEKRCLINNATYWDGEWGATFAMILLQPKVRWLTPSIRKTNLYFISLVKKYGLGLQVHQQSCLMATLGEPFSRFIRNFWVEVRCDWLSGTAGDSVSEREDFFALMSFRGLFIY